MKNNVSEIKQMWSLRCYLGKINMKMLSYLATLAANWIFQTQPIHIYPFKPQKQQYQGHVTDTQEMSKPNYPSKHS